MGKNAGCKTELVQLNLKHFFCLLGRERSDTFDYQAIYCVNIILIKKTKIKNLGTNKPFFTISAF